MMKKNQPTPTKTKQKINKISPDSPTVTHLINEANSQQGTPTQQPDKKNS